MLTITNAATTDIPLIRELTMKVWPQTYTPIVGETQVAYMLHRFYEPGALTAHMESGHQFIICFDGAEAVGFASYAATEQQVYKLHKLYILPDRQGKGIGRFMVGHITHDVQQRNGTALRLNVNRYNKQAMAFYAGNGFRHLLDEDIDIGDGYFMNDHVLELDLRKPDNTNA